MDNQQLSIIIPHYNSPDKLRRMLESVFGYDDIQVIVVDDGSTIEKDKYDRLKKDYSGVEFYDNSSENKSAGGARNEGLKHAKGKWVLFGDADDYFASNMYDLAEKYFEEDVDVVFFLMDACLDDETHAHSDRCSYYTSMARRYYKKYEQCKSSVFKAWKIAPIEREIRNNWLSPCAKMVKKDFIDREGIKFEVVKYANDNFFSVQVGCKAKKILVSNQVIYHVTEAPGTLTNNDDSSMGQIRRDVWERCLKYIEKNENKYLRFRANIAEMIWNKKRR